MTAPSRTSRLALALGVAGLGATGLAAAPAASAAAKPAPHTVIAVGLDNPRQLTLLADRHLLIAETGSGGSTCVGRGERRQCVGATGGVAYVRDPATAVARTATATAPRRVVTGLVSTAGPGGLFATGASAVASRHIGSVYSAVSYAPPEAWLGRPQGRQAGKLLLTRGAATRTVGQVAAFEAVSDPDRQGVESNPYAALALPDQVLVADAAGNSVVSVAGDGTESLFAVLPTITTGACGKARDVDGDGDVDAGDRNEDGTLSCDSVPTSLALGPDGAVYVGGLASEVPGEGRVWKLDASTGEVLETWSGFTTVTGVAVGADGSVYASELMADFQPPMSGGAVTRVAPDGKRTSVAVPLPAGIAVDSKGNVLVAAHSVAPATGMPGPKGPDRSTSGQVWRFAPSAFGG